jgi:hypothetical protein
VFQKLVLNDTLFDESVYNVSNMNACFCTLIYVIHKRNLWGSVRDFEMVVCRVQVDIIFRL